MTRNLSASRRAGIAVCSVVLALAGAYAVATPSAVAHPDHATSSAHDDAMSAECWRALAGYIFATDQEDSDFWAESWSVFGCGGGYYA